MKNNLLWMGKSCPNKFKSAGDIRSLMMLSILAGKYNVTAMFTSADFGLNDIRAIGVEPVQNGAEWVFDEISGKNKPSLIIISHWTCGHRYIDYIRKRTNVPIILDTIDLEYLRIQRECEWKNIPNKHRMDAELDIYMKSDSLIMASEIDKQELKKHLPHKKMVVIPCMFELNKHELANTNQVYTVCNWLHKPNVDATLWLCEKIMPHVDAVLNIVGKHPPAELTKYASNKIVFHGWVPNMNNFCMDKAACLCPILYGSGSNGKVAQSGSMGIPIITTPLGALPYGLTQDSAMIADNPEDYIAAVKTILTDRVLAQKIADNAFNLMEKYTIPMYRDTILALGEI